jgi:hypothetical protein
VYFPLRFSSNASELRKMIDLSPIAVFPDFDLVKAVIRFVAADTLDELAAASWIGFEVEAWSEESSLCVSATEATG